MSKHPLHEAFDLAWFGDRGFLSFLAFLGFRFGNRFGLTLGSTFGHSRLKKS
jgi:hypothetical protein